MEVAKSKSHILIPAWKLKGLWSMLIECLFDTYLIILIKNMDIA